MICVVKINHFSTSTHPLEFNVDVIKTFMEQNSANLLFLLKSPYEFKFSVDRLDKLIDNELYGILQVQNEQTSTSSATGDDFSVIFLNFIKVCHDILIKSDLTQQSNNEILLQNQRSIEICQSTVDYNRSIMKRYEELLDQFLEIQKASSDMQKQIVEIYKIIKDDQTNLVETQNQMRDFHEKAQADLLKKQELMRDLYEATQTNQKVLLKFISQ